MKASYDSQADTIQIVLQPIDRLERDDTEVSGAIVGIRDGVPVMIDVIGTPTGMDRRLRVVAERHDLDSEALSASAHACLAAPDRVLTLVVGLRTSLE
ncbi:MAG: hypothetical protein WD827_05350 [Solirubrobacterales bacterium]